MRLRSFLDANVFHNTAAIWKGTRLRYYYNITKSSKQRIICWKSKTDPDWANTYRIPSVDERKEQHD